MEKTFDAHIHYAFKIPIDKTIDIFKKEFEMTGAVKYNFLSVPHYFFAAEPEFQPTQNIKGLFLKKVFSPDGYCYAGLEHPFENGKFVGDKNQLKKLFLEQVTEYYNAGFDGIKMFEGYPQLRKWMQVPLDDEMYDDFYTFCEQHNFPITLHVANPEENWDINKVSAYALKVGRFCDETFPTKQQLTDEVFSVMRKHPKLRLALAHFGFLCYKKEDAERYLEEFENTMFDLTPGGEEMLMQSKDWGVWEEFYNKYQDRIVYGTDLYAFPLDDEKTWTENVMRRPRFLRQFYETSGSYDYIGKSFNAINLDKNIRKKIYFDNEYKALGEPRKIDENYLLKTAEDLAKSDLNEMDKNDMEYIIDYLKR